METTIRPEDLCNTSRTVSRRQLHAQAGEHVTSRDAAADPGMQADPSGVKRASAARAPSSRLRRRPEPSTSTAARPSSHPSVPHHDPHPSRDTICRVALDGAGVHSSGGAGSLSSSRDLKVTEEKTTSDVVFLAGERTLDAGRASLHAVPADVGACAIEPARRRRTRLSQHECENSVHDRSAHGPHPTSQPTPARRRILHE
ncbi:hypothetical protein BV20DRAFT_808701 [Pilatotrama ljubarskyi]|nr:hypothetical protein BV20DRAFT_808701 [Pilatotrama ljubarskyi]